MGVFPAMPGAGFQLPEVSPAALFRQSRSAGEACGIHCACEPRFKTHRIVHP